MAGPARRLVALEEWVERRAEYRDGVTVERRLLRARWATTTTRQRTGSRVLETAVPLLRAVAIAVAPTVAHLAVRALAPRLRNAVWIARPARPLGPRALPRALPASLPPEPRPGR
jgi:hypothetical protein